MTSSEYQFLKDTEEKAIKVVKSCRTKAQLRAANRYIILLNQRYTQEFKLDKTSRNPNDFKLCHSITIGLGLKITQRKLSLKN